MPDVRLVDSHCHLQADRFDEDVEPVVGAARLEGVERILVPGWDLASSRRAHGTRRPVFRGSMRAWASTRTMRPVPALATGTRSPPSPRIRESSRWGTGLDFDRVFSPIDDQLVNLRRHLGLARDLGKPAILHVRSAAGRSDAQDALLAELKAAGFDGAAVAATFGGRPPAVIHSFSGSIDFGRAVLDLGLAVSISGLAFRAGEESTAEVVPLVSLDRLLVETDSPFLSPPGAPRRRNEPEWVRVTAQWVAERRGIPPGELGESSSSPTKPRSGGR